MNKTHYLAILFLFGIFYSTKAQFTQNLHDTRVQGYPAACDQYGNVFFWATIATSDTLGGVGYPNGTSNGRGIAKFDPLGNLLWVSMLNSGGSSIGAMDVDANGNLVFTVQYIFPLSWGGFGDTTLLGYESALGFIDSVGVLRWLHGYDNRQSRTTDVKFLQNGNIAHTISVHGPATFNGYTMPPSDSAVGHCLILDRNANVLQDFHINAFGKSEFTCIEEGPAGDLYAIGHFYDSDSAIWLGATIPAHSAPTEPQAFITRFDQSGNLGWFTAFDTSTAYFHGIAVASNGDCYFAGQMSGNNLGLGGVTVSSPMLMGAEMLLGKLNGNGSTAWFKASASVNPYNYLDRLDYHPSGKLVVSGQKVGPGSFLGNPLPTSDTAATASYIAILDSSSALIASFVLENNVLAQGPTKFIDSISIFIGGSHYYESGQNLFNWPFASNGVASSGWWAEVGIQSNSLRGIHYADLDNNGSFGGNDMPVTNSLVSTGNGLLSLSNALGEFQLNVGTGSYIVTSQAPSPLFSVSPATYSGTFTGFGNVDSSLVFRSIPSQIIPDLQLELIAGAGARIGGNNNLSLLSTNIGSAPGSGTVTLELDPLTSFVSATPAPDTIQGNHIAWNIGSIAPFGSSLISATFYLDTTAMLGDSILHAAHITGTVADFDSSNQSDTVAMVAVTSFDPNDKQVSPASAAPNSAHALGTAPLKYQIRFQNTGTAAAHRVVVRDTLPAGLDMASFRMIGSSHPYTLSLRNGNLLTWVFDPIVLPDSGSDLSGSNGFLVFEINANPGLVLGDSISNRCGIYFDYNAPVLTNSAVFRVTNEVVAVPQANTPQEVQLYPNPGTDGFGLKGLSPSQFPVKVAVYDFEGKLRIEQEITVANQLARVSAAQLSNGLFLVRVGTAKGEILSFRWMHR